MSLFIRTRTSNFLLSEVEGKSSYFLSVCGFDNYRQIQESLENYSTSLHSVEAIAKD